MNTVSKRPAIVFASLNLALFLGVLTVNALASILPLNGKNTGELSDLYPNLFVPAGLTFSIWGLIYLLLLGMVIYQLVLAVRQNDPGQLSINGARMLGVNFLLNMAWIFAWHYEMVGLSVIIMLGLLLTLIYLFREIDGLELNNSWSGLLVKAPISVYLGWISVATIANVTSWLVDLNWSGFGVSQVSWTITVILVGGILAILMLNIRKNLAYAAVVVWAYLGIVLKRGAIDPVQNGIINTAYIVMGVILIYMIVTVFQKMRTR